MLGFASQPWVIGAVGFGGWLCQHSVVMMFDGVAGVVMVFSGWCRFSGDVLRHAHGFDTMRFDCLAKA